MKVTWTTFAHNFTSAGIIANNVIIELTKLGIDVGYNVLNLHELSNDDLKTFPIEVQEAIKKGIREDSINIFFSYPDIYNHFKTKINVGYTGADSSGWYKTNFKQSPSSICNQLMDYMLTPSEYSKKIMKENGVNIPIKIFPHGINPSIFKPFKRQLSYPFNFLYTGELSERKGTQDLIRVFKGLYGNNNDYQLILRANTHMKFYGSDEIINLCKDYSNIKLIWKDAGQEDLSSYIQTSHVYVYPSRADWLGMTPFEALFSGLPTIVTASNGYYEFLKDWVIPLKFKEEYIGNKHPYLDGKWNCPILKDLEEIMIHITDPKQYERISSWTYENSQKINKKFTWEKVTKEYLVPFLEEIDKKERMKIVENKKVTVSIPTKDRPLELGLLLQSLLFQTYKDFDVLIIDDCYTGVLQKNTTIQSLCKLLQDSGHNVTIISGEKKGPHVAGQKILENSKTELILRLDDDVFLRPSFIEELVKVFEDNSIGAVGPVYLNPHEPLVNQVIDKNLSQDFLEKQGKVFWDENGHLWLSGYLNVNIHPTENLMKVEHLNSGFMYRKSAALKIGGYFLGFSQVGHREESDFSYRLFREGYNLFINPRAIAFHSHPMSGGIRETNGEMLRRDNWDHDEKLFLERMEKILPKPKVIGEESFTSVIILTCGIDHKSLRELLKGIETYTNHKCEYIIVNNDSSKESLEDIIKIPSEFNQLDIHIITIKDTSVSEARNIGVTYTSPLSKYICFIDDDARILGRYNQVTDWVDYLYNRFHEQPDVGVVSPIVTWCDYFQSYVASVACMFTSKKVWEVVGGFDPVFGNKEKQTWGYEDTDISYRLFLKGFKILRVVGNDFPFYHGDTTFKPKSSEREQALLKAKDLLLNKYDINEIKKYNRTVYPLTEEQMNMNGIKLNIGCYHMQLDGFTNVDIKNDIGADLICNGKDLYKHFQINSVDMILASHMLEHVKYEEAKSMLQSWKLILKPKGILTLEVPDCENLEEKLEKGIIDKQLYETIKHGCPPEFGQKHEFEYTREILKNLLTEVGFIDIIENKNTSLGINFKLRSESFRYDCRKV